MKTAFLLKGHATLEKDLKKLFEHTYCAEKEVKTAPYGTVISSIYREFEYKKATIIVPKKHYHEFNVSWTEKGKGYQDEPTHPFWYVLRTAQAIYQNAIIKDVSKFSFSALEEYPCYQPYASKSALGEFYTRKTEHIEHIERVKELFQKEDWVTPNYLYWSGKDKRVQTMQAVLELGVVSGFTAPVPTTLTEKINNIIPKELYQQDVLVVEMRN